MFPSKGERLGAIFRIIDNKSKHPSVTPDDEQDRPTSGLERKALFNLKN